MHDTADILRVLNFIREPMFVVAMSGEVEVMNRAAHELLPAGERGASLFDLFAGSRDDLKRYLRRCSGSASPLPGALKLPGANGAEKKLQVEGALFTPAGAGRRARIILRLRPQGIEQFSFLGRKIQELNRELFERRRLEVSLQETLVHKDNLLKELQHRVKNYTQLILSMLSAASRTSTSAELSQFIASLSARLMAMGAAQQLMYQSAESDGISAPSLLHRLCDTISESWPDGAGMEVAADEAEISTDVAGPLALIVNELAANALKHGLKYGAGRVFVSLRRLDGEMVLAVWDNGTGWSPESDPVGPSSGLMLVRGLCRQIGGGLEVRRGEGTTCLVRFPADGRSARNARNR